MSLVTVSCTIKGISALLMNQYPMIPIEHIEKRSPEEQAEYAVYRDKQIGELYIPAIAVQRALIGGAAYSKGKGRASLQKPVAACVNVSPEYLYLGTKEYTIDARSVVIPATHGRVVRFRPRLDNWKVSFQIEFDNDLLKETELRKIVDDTGTRVGLLDFRPERKGPFGRFSVVEWK